MFNEKQWNSIYSYCSTKLFSLYDPSSLFIEQQDLRGELQISHKGFYIGIVSSNNENIIREGFLQDSFNVLDSANKCVESAFARLQSMSVPLSKIKTSTIYLTLVLDVIYIENPLDWDENKDGVYFQWGDEFKGIYLPYQIKKINSRKIDIMDNLCVLEAGVVSNLWRLPEGMCYRLLCESHSS